MADNKMIKVVGPSGCVMELDEQLANALLRDESVKFVDDEPKPAKKAAKATKASNPAPPQE